MEAVRTNLDYKTLKLFVEEMMEMFEQQLEDQHIHITETTEVTIDISHVNEEHIIFMMIRDV